MKPGVWWLGVLVASAGCVSGGSTPGASTPVVTEATADASTGGIEVQVTDDEVVPIAQAQVAVIGTQHKGETDSAGRVAFSGLEPMRYVVIVGRIGYNDGQEAIDVVAGEVATIKVVLERIPVAEPRFDDVYTWNDGLPVADGCAERDSGQWRDETRGVTWQKYTFTVNATKPDGSDLLAIRMDIVLKHREADATIDIDMRLYDDAGKQLGTGGTAAADERIDLQKIMKPGTYHVHVCYWAGAQAEYKLTATMTYEQGERAAYLREHPDEIEYPDEP